MLISVATAYLQGSGLRARATVLAGTRRRDGGITNRQGSAKNARLELLSVAENRSYLSSHRRGDVSSPKIPGRPAVPQTPPRSTPGPTPAPGAPRAGHRQTPASHIVYPNLPPESTGRPGRRFSPPPPPWPPPAAAKAGRSPDGSVLPGIFARGDPPGGAANTICFSRARSTCPSGPKTASPSAAARPPRRGAAAAPRGPPGPRPARRRRACQLRGHHALAAGHSAQ